MTQMTVYQRPPVFQRRVAGLGGRMPEIGKIKIGRVGDPRPTRSGEGTWQPPQKLDHFIVTSMRRGQDGNFLRDEAVHAVLGDKPRELPIKLLSNDPDVNLVSRYAYYKGKMHLFCQGDGERAWRQERPQAQRVERACPCEFLISGECKINGIFRCLIDLPGMPSLGGVYVFRTTGRNSVENLYTAMDLITAVTRGRLANIPLTLGVTVKTSQFRDKNGAAQTATFPMVTLRYSGSVDELLNVSLAAITSESAYASQIKLLEQRMGAGAVLDAIPEEPEEQAAIVEEFYPEAANGGEIVDADTGEVIEEQQKRRGRPPGSRNRPKGGDPDATAGESPARQAAQEPQPFDHAKATPDDSAPAPGPADDGGQYDMIDRGEPVPAGNGGPKGYRPPPPSSAGDDDGEIPDLGI